MVVSSKHGVAPTWVAERLNDINPDAHVRPIQLFSDDLDDSHFEELLAKPLNGSPPAVTVLCAMTDGFSAQARANRLALQFGVPHLAAQLYAEGRGAEVTFSHPMTTPSCHRCVLRSRYEAFIQQGFRGGTPSDGTPISSTARLNATKFLVTMALLHYGTSHPRWGRTLEQIGNRNLVQLRMDPSLDLPVFDRVFLHADRDRLFVDDTVWLPQLPDNPANGFPVCPDCLGRGDLRLLVGTFDDTREMRTTEQPIDRTRLAGVSNSS